MRNLCKNDHAAENIGPGLGE